jgi:hypothetical protein
MNNIVFKGIRLKGQHASGFDEIRNDYLVSRPSFRPRV